MSGVLSVLRGSVKRLWLFGALFIILSGSFAFQEFQQNGGARGLIRAFFAAAIVAALAYLVIAAGIEYFKHSRIAPIIVAILLFVGGIRLIGAYSFAADAVCWMLGLLALPAAIAIRKRWRRRKPAAEISSAGQIRMLVSVFLVATWLCLWGADYVSQHRAIASQAGPIETRYRYEGDSSRAFGPLDGSNNTRVGLALSGGGYRAALMHAGVLSLLDSINVHPQVISSVSGGSIIAAFYHGGRPPSAFLQAMKEGRFHLRRELFHPPQLLWILATLPVPRTTYTILPLRIRTRTHVQAAILDRLFMRDAVIGDTSDSGHHDELMLCATELSSGALVGFLNNGAVVKPVDPPVWRFGSLSMKKTPSAASFITWSERARHSSHAAMLVAASGAFPGAFKPVKVPISGKLQPNTPLTNPMVLSDGGITDNLGLVLLYTAADLAKSADAPNAPSKQWVVNTVIASDGSALSAPQTPSNTVRVLSAAIDAVSRTSAAASLVTLDPLPVILSPAPLIRDIKKAITKAVAPDGLVTLPFGNAPDPALTNRVEIRDKHEDEPALSYLNLDMNDLRFFAAHMDTATTDPSALQKELANAQYRLGGGTLIGSEARLGESRDRSLHHRVELELARRIKVFVNTSTLDDRVSKDDAESLYILGQYLVLLNKSFIRYALQHPKSLTAVPRCPSNATC